MPDISHTRALQVLSKCPAQTAATLKLTSDLFKLGATSVQQRLQGMAERDQDQDV